MSNRNGLAVSYAGLFRSMMVKYRDHQKDRAFVLIGGCSRSGKTTLSKKIEQDLNREGIASAIINLDNWLMGIDERSGKETVRERYHYENIERDIRKLQAGYPIHPPVYDPRTRMIISRSRPGAISLRGGGIGIVDGTIALDIEALRKVALFKIFVEVEDNVRFVRLMRFYFEFKGCNLDETFSIIQNREKEEVRIIKETKPYADVIYMSQ